VRVVIAEDSVLLRAGLVSVLQAMGITVQEAVGDGELLLAAVGRHRPDVAVIDVRMPPTHTDEGLVAALAIRRQWPGVHVLILSQYIEERYAAELLADDCRGVGYLLKERVAHVGEFVDALHRIAQGGTVLDPQVVSQLLLRRRGGPLERLTGREREVLALMAEGHSNTVISRLLTITDSAVGKHINNIFAKLGLPPGADGASRRVTAVLRFLEERGP
jgi:DNA-binding NarL/FixJ family response regulator